MRNERQQLLVHGGNHTFCDVSPVTIICECILVVVLVCLLLVWSAFLSSHAVSLFAAAIAPELTAAKSDPPGIGRPVLAFEVLAERRFTDLLKRKS